MFILYYRTTELIILYMTELATGCVPMHNNYFGMAQTDACSAIIASVLLTAFLLYSPTIKVGS